MSTISAGTTSGTALVSSGDTTGQLVIQTNGTTTAMTIGTDQVVTVNGTTTVGAQIRLLEGSNNGTNYVAVKAPNSVASDVTFTLPSADGTNGQFLQTNGSGQLAFATVPTTSPGGTTGQVQVNNSGAFGAISEGTSGQVLTSNGAGVAPSFATPTVGSLILVQTVTGSGVDTIDITGNFTSTYRIYKLYITASFSGSTQVGFRFYINGALVSTSTYGYGGAYAASGNPAFSGNSGVSNMVGNSLSAKVNTFEMTFFNPSDSTNRAPVFVVATGATDATSSYFNGQFFNATTGTAGTRAITGIQASTGGTSGTWTAKLYGIKE